MIALRLALRQLARDWRASELGVLALALVIAVAAVTSVAFFTDRIHRALATQASDMLGGDLALRSRSAIESERIELLQTLGMEYAQTVEFPTMVIADGESQLVALKAVSDGYPLRGQLRASSRLFAPDAQVDDAPVPGQAWAAVSLYSKLGLQVGDYIDVGDTRLQLTRVLTSEPDQTQGMMFAIAPRLMIHEQDLATTGLVQSSSRLSHQLLIAGDSTTINSLRDEWQPRLLPGQSLMDVQDARPEVRTALERADAFLGLASLVSVLLAGTAVAMAARRYVQRHLDHCAVMRCVGASQQTIGRIYLFQLLLLALSASVLGTIIGYLGQWALVAVLGPLANFELPAAGWWPWLLGVLTGFITLLGFAMPPIMQLRNVPTLRVLRRDLGAAAPNALLAYGAALLAILSLVLVQANNLKLALASLGGLLLVLMLLGLVAWLMLLLLRRGVHHGRAAWRVALMNISRRGNSSVLQMVGFSIGLMALLLLAVVRTDLMDEWQGRLPADTPNRFLINIQSEQLPAVQQFFQQQQAVVPDLYPMVRARLVAINGTTIDPTAFDTERGQRLAQREFNLTWTDEVPAENEVIAGQWWQANSTRAQLSLEDGIAEALGVKLGDVMLYQIGGFDFEAEVTSLRTVEWDTFRPNFFVIAPTAVLDSYPASYISGFYLPPAQHELLNALVQQFPNITVIDVAGIIDHVRSIVDRVVLAVEFVFLFTLAAGLMVMYAAIYSTLDERLREAAVMRMLGARRDQIMRSLMLEYAGLGMLSGLVAAIVAGGVGMIVASQVFELSYIPGPSLWLGGMLLGALIVGIAGTLGTRRVVVQPPLQVLQRV